MLLWTGEMGQGARQHFAWGPDAQLGLSAGHVALFFMEMWPKEAKGGRIVRYQSKTIRGTKHVPYDTQLCPIIVK